MVGIDEIARRLPHRHPMLLIDEVTELVPGERLIARKAVTASEPWFRRDPNGSNGGPIHFPPVLLLESLCQAATLLAVWDAPTSGLMRGKAMLLGSLSDATFHASVTPGSLIHHHVSLSRDLGDNFLVGGTSLVEDRLVLSVKQVLVALRPSRTLSS